MDPKEFREVGHRVVDFLAEYLDHIKERRVFPNVEPQVVNELFAEPLPQDPSSAESVLNELESKLLPYCTHVGHPGYMGLITPSPNPVGIIGDFICSAINQNVGAYSIGPSAVAMERRVVRWLTDLCGYGAKAGGNLTSGGMMANFIGLKVGRDAVTEDVAQHDGIHDRWAVYASEERHVSVDKAVDCVGLGPKCSARTADRHELSGADRCTRRGNRARQERQDPPDVCCGRVWNYEHRGRR
jgi:aromatic-L-amino-acid decarboxylase